MNERLLQQAKDAIDRLFSDKSVSVRQAIENMEELQSDIECKIDALKSDHERGGKMPLRKIADFKDIQPCRDPEHNPPAMIVLEPGVYEHECPACGKKQTFTVPSRPSL